METSRKAQHLAYSAPSLAVSTGDDLSGGPRPWPISALIHKISGLSPNIIYVYNHRDRALEYGGRTLAAHLGYTEGELAAMGAELLPRIVHEDDLQHVLDHFHRLDELGAEAFSGFEYRMRARSGETRWFASKDTVFDRDPEGRLLRHCGVATDVTEHKRAEARLTREKRDMDSANIQLQSFAYSVSHDLKSPSNTLKMLLSEVRFRSDAQLGPDSADLLDLSLQTVDRMRTLVEDVLDYTRVIGQRPQLEPIDLRAMVEAIRIDLHADIAQTGGRVEIGELYPVHGSAAQVRMLLQNLIANGLKYHRDGHPPQIRVNMTERPDRSTALIHVTDNGMGIPEDALDTIFVMFKRLHLHSELQGTGLGLAICRQIAVNHGGEIRVRSEVGSGSTFTVSLPRPPS